MARIASWIAISGLGLMLSGCAVVRSAGDRERMVWFWRGRRAVRAGRAEAAGTLFGCRRCGVAERTVLGLVGKLALAGVLSYRVEGGFAYVTSEKSGRSGWVRERQLIERLPVMKKPVAEPPPRPAAEQPSTQEEPSTQQESPAESEPPAPEEPPAPPREKSIFDPY